MKRRRFTAVSIAALALVPSSVEAASVQVVGKIVIAQGHEAPACRKVRLQLNDDGTLMWFRIPETNKDDGILAVTMTALTTGLDVAITYDPALTSGCGTEPKILYISLMAPS